MEVIPTVLDEELSLRAKQVALMQKLSLGQHLQPRNHESPMPRARYQGLSLPAGDLRRRPR